ncbi:MAG: pilus assembly FimT family protein [Candidatus Polarisedimenticolia bacterium]
MSFPEIIAALTIASLALAMAAPVSAEMARAWRLDGAARALAMEVHRARMEALARGRSTGILFARSPRGGQWRFHVDTSGDRSITSAAIVAGQDRALGPLVEMASRHPGVSLGIAAGPPIPRIPPASGVLTFADDPIAFGGSDIFSASPTGEGSAGTLYLTDGFAMRAIVVSGATGRVRVWRWDRSHGWRLA